MSTNVRSPPRARRTSRPTREAHDAAHKPALQLDPSNYDAKLDIELDESFPSIDPPSNTQPRRGSDPAPSAGFKE